MITKMIVIFLLFTLGAYAIISEYSYFDLDYSNENLILYVIIFILSFLLWKKSNKYSKLENDLNILVEELEI